MENCLYRRVSENEIKRVLEKCIHVNQFGICAAWQCYYKGLLLAKHTDGTMIHADKCGLAINASRKMRFISSSRYHA